MQLLRCVSPALCILAMLIGLLPTLSLAADQAERPNVVFVLIDDLRWDALGCTGHPFLKTPHIDRIAREGVNFRNAFVTTPLCSPSRASYLTGQYAHTHQQLATAAKAAAAIRSSPFRCCCSGPVMRRPTSASGTWADDDSPRPGFDRWVSFKGQGDYINPDAQRGRHAGEDGRLCDRHPHRSRRRVSQAPARQAVPAVSGSQGVHSGFTPAQRHKDEFADRTIPRAPSVQDTLEGKPVLTRAASRGQSSTGQNPGRKDRAVYGQLRGILAIDEGIGRLLATWKRPNSWTTRW